MSSSAPAAVKLQLITETSSTPSTVIISDKPSVTKLKPFITTLSDVILKLMSCNVALSPIKVIGLSISFHNVFSENSPMNVNVSGLIPSLKEPYSVKNKKNVSLVKS